MTVTTKAASDGGAITKAEQARRAGIGLVRDSEAYHLASLARDAAYEAERLCAAVLRAAERVYLPVTGGDVPADDGQGWMTRADKISDALECLRVAGEYLDALADREPPF